jgi:archaellum biogenesis ATPase FlaH
LRQCLWLYGEAGCGKTILSATILNHLLQLDTGHTTLAFFFDYNDPKKQQLEDLLYLLAVQLYYTRGDAARTLVSLYTSHDDGCKEPDTEALSDCINTILGVTGKAFVIIDALDECITRNELFHWIKGSASNNAQILVTGRPEVDFRREIPRLIDERNCVPLDKRSVNANIHHYIEAMLD